MSNPTRHRILELLKDGERQVGEWGQSSPPCSQPFPTSQDTPKPALSLYLRIAEAPLPLLPDRLREWDTWVSSYRRFWSEPLESNNFILVSGGTKKNLARFGCMEGMVSTCVAQTDARQNFLCVRILSDSYPVEIKLLERHTVADYACDSTEVLNKLLTSQTKFDWIFRVQRPGRELVSAVNFPSTGSVQGKGV